MKLFELVRTYGIFGAASKDSLPDEYSQSISKQVTRRPETQAERDELAKAVKDTRGVHRQKRNTRPRPNSNFKVTQTYAADKNNAHRGDAQTKVDWKAKKDIEEAAPQLAPAREQNPPSKRWPRGHFVEWELIARSDGTICVKGYLDRQRTTSEPITKITSPQDDIGNYNIVTKDGKEFDLFLSDALLKFKQAVAERHNFLRGFWIKQREDAKRNGKEIKNPNPKTQPVVALIQATPGYDRFSASQKLSIDTE